ncbi:major outer membrane protein [Aliarcobacter skirrowii]|uniref:major outer membrane protein n=1 Tax=Aliarcobacter skirrowii TaxID=28200 RepID=UPI0029B505AF|nr:major outer membrane protein [Aliarcobacter skirrowii]MDX4065160.1 major outer membrane protein [Aliarcobacter skirrowii]
MKKFTKLSLVAAVAVAGLTSANAKPLEEAIKDVEVSGSVVYRYDEKDNSKAAGNQTNADNNYKIGLNLSSKVNDYVKFNSRFVVGGADSGFASLNSSTNNDQNVDVTLSHAYFALTAIPNTTVNVGKQGLATPWTVANDINGNEQTGTGILALSNVGPVTLAAGYFNQTNLDKSGDHPLTGGVYNIGTKDIATVAAIANIVDVAQVEAWYLTMQDQFDTYTLAATSKLDLAENAKIGLEARYVNLELDNKNVLGLTGDAKKNDMFRLAVDGKVGIVNARIAYTNTGKHGGLTALDNDAKNTSLGWNLSSNSIQDAEYLQLALGADILENLNFTAHYGSLESKESAADTERSEIYGQLTYKMSKNLTTYVRYGQNEVKTKSTGVKSVDQDRGRIQVAYTF